MEAILDQSVIWQSLNISSPFYSLQQNGEVLPTLRTHLEQEIEITAYVWKSAQVNLTFKDVINPDRYNNVTLNISASEGDKNFIHNMDNFGNQASDWQLKIPANKDVIFEWEVYEGPDYSDVTLVDMQNDILNLKFEEVINYTIEH